MLVSLFWDSCTLLHASDWVCKDKNESSQSAARGQRLLSIHREQVAAAIPEAGKDGSPINVHIVIHDDAISAFCVSAAMF